MDHPDEKPNHERSIENGDISPEASSRPSETSLSLKEKRTAQFQFLSLCGSLFLFGWNDGSTGPLLPRIHEDYNIGFSTLSLVFLISWTGCFAGALLNIPLSDRFGIGKMLVSSAVVQAVGFGIQALRPPFPVFVASFIASGIGIAIQDAQSNGFLAILQKDSDKKLALLHASYGVGALLSPIVATQFAQLKHWSLHYAVSFSLAIANTASQALVFRFQDIDENLIRSGEVIPEKVVEQEDSRRSKISRLLRSKNVHLLTLFLTIYVGVEVAIGGWIVTIMIYKRGGGPSSGYIVSGFYGGMTLGRVALIKVNKMIGEIRAIYVYTLLSIFLQLVVWLVPSLIADAVAVSFIGVMFGPLYPIAVGHGARILPRELVTGAIGWIVACSAGGAAILPFIFGLVAGKAGVGTLPPLVLALIVVMGGVWITVPKK